MTQDPERPVPSPVSHGTKIAIVPVVASVRVLTRYAWWKVTGVDLAARAAIGQSTG